MAPSPPVVEDQPQEALEVLGEPNRVRLSHSQVLAIIKPLMEDVLDGTEQEASGEMAFMDAGMDSLNAVSFRNDVAKTMDVTLPATVVFDFPNLNSLASHILEI